MRQAFDNKCGPFVLKGQYITLEKQAAWGEKLLDFSPSKVSQRYHLALPVTLTFLSAYKLMFIVSEHLHTDNSKRLLKQHGGGLSHHLSQLAEIVRSNAIISF